MRVAVMGHTYIVDANRGKFRAMQKRGHEVLLVSPSTWPEPDFGLRRFETCNDIAYELFDCPRAGQVRRFAYPHRFIHRTLRQWRPDVLLAETEPGGLAALQAVTLCVSLAIPLVPFAWENLPITGRSRLTCLPVYHSARRLLVGSHGAAETARKAGYRGYFSVLPQVGVNPMQLQPHKKAGDITLHALFVGRLDRKKGADLLINALTQPSAIKWRVTIVGDGSERADLEKLAGDLGLQHRVVFYGAVPHTQVPKLFADADALVSPSRAVPGWTEQFGHILAWAMAAGVPVVASDCGAIPEVVGDAGLIVPQNNAPAIAAALERLQETKLREEYGQSGKNRVFSLYTDQAVALRLERALVLALRRTEVDDG